MAATRTLVLERVLALLGLRRATLQERVDGAVDDALGLQLDERIARATEVSDAGNPARAVGLLLFAIAEFRARRVR